MEEDYLGKHASDFVRLEKHFSSREFLLKVEVYDCNSNRTEFNVLGSTKLSSFTKSISCPNELLRVGDPKECSASLPLKHFLGTKLLFLGRAFRWEMQPQNDTYSSKEKKSQMSHLVQPILQWARENDTSVKNLNRGWVGDIRFKDLHIRFGYPYLYAHLGICEHTVVFVEARPINSDEQNILALYPFQLPQENTSKFVLCSTCEAHEAKWIVCDYQSQFCDFCFKMFFSLAPPKKYFRRDQKVQESQPIDDEKSESPPKKHFCGEQNSIVVTK